MPTNVTPHPARYTVKAYVAHQTGHRLRLRLTAPPGGDSGELANRLARVDGAHRVRIRPNTASVIIDTLVPTETVLQTLQDSGLVKILAPLKHPPLGQVIDLGLAQADMAIGNQTDGALDLRTLIALMLAAGAVVQLTRGRIASPAASLAMSAYSLLSRRK
ncbi:HMA2 domain-containing protein [Antarctobacter sp.]|uniref:HMA2 domain-containing protein n=1 Tax=Antarctobacter sp. TaxID=1872577 RepID=UPI002B270C6E|nr:hypothetical protein [Antarctobacter sp.]